MEPPNQFPPQAPQPPPPNQPLFNAPYNAPMQQQPVVLPPQPPVPPEETKQAGNKLPLVLGIVAAIELLLIIGLLIAVAAKPKTSKTANNNAGNTSQSQGPTAATSTSVQTGSDSISQDISGLNDDKDFPTKALDDSSLGL